MYIHEIYILVCFYIIYKLLVYDELEERRERIERREEKQDDRKEEEEREEEGRQN